MSVSGKYLTAKIGAAEIKGTYAWRVSERYEKLDAITAADNGNNRKDFGVGEAEISLRLLIDIASGAYEPVAAGTEITALTLYRKKGDAQPAYSFPLVRIFDSEQGAEIRGRVEVNATGENVGIYARNEPAAP
ncbi:hypothetical protein VT84_30625 [Gemmata sp. SH-PL17]|uniref:hypothetical protein n=1 Tax=Gemmata sp. SH-PL17 TaxID=1630693 RepID=UPI00078C2FE1|nr:hypothetical protein [Gemmata sp. SH-PL17]AMV28788.1 hypothetical protein VT84_30625 [Gemmata sp. SH-PL17]